MKVSVILSVHNRAQLLRRSLMTYMGQALNKEEFELIIIDDNSQDDTPEVIGQFKDQLRIIHLYLQNPKGKFRSQSAGWNLGLSLSCGEVCLFSHPEILMPPLTLEKMYEAVTGFSDPVFVTMKPYGFSPACQAKIDTVDWERDLNRIKSLPEFYGDSWMDGGRTVWNNKKMEDPKLKWESNTTFAMRRKDLLNIGGFREFDRWGPDDPDLLKRRQRLKIPTLVLNDLLNYHQNHDELSREQRKQDFKIPWYPFRRSAIMKLNKHIGEYQVISCWRDKLGH
jgi:glycosyltransferase involved in cell wall biosynthesis